MRLPWMLRIASVLVLCCAAPAQYVVTNNDVAAPFTSSATFYTIAPDGTLGHKTVVSTGGAGIAGGYFTTPRVALAPRGPDQCVYISNAGTGDIAGISGLTQTLTGNFKGSRTDSGSANGIGLAINDKYLYASFTFSGTIATFQVQKGCALNFLTDVAASGLNSGAVMGMAIHANIMVVAYGDGSIESFDISSGAPVSNGDKQNSTGAADDHFPVGVDITQDGHYAIFGDASTITTVEVADISSGKLTPSIPYDLAHVWNSGNVRLSPDETLLYISNDSAGQVTAAFFDKATGKVSKGCTSPPLTGYYTRWGYVGEIATQLNTGTGGMLYVAEFGSGGKPSSIGLIGLASNGASCTLTESPKSPANDPNAQVLSFGVYPSRQF